MTEITTPLGLHRLPTNELKRLLRALHRGAIASPVTRASLVEKGFGDIEGHLGLVVGKDQASACAILVAALGERSLSARGGVELSWLGPPLPGTRSRDLPLQVKELAFSASVRLELYGLTGAEEEDALLDSVRAAMRARGLQVRLVFTAEDALDDGALVHAVGARFAGLSPELLRVRGIHFGMRAVVVDEQRALITTGPLSAVEEDGRVEAGALLEDAAWVAALRREWGHLTASGRVVRLGALPKSPGP